MFIDVIDWDDEHDLKGNTWHIIGPDEVTVEEVEEVLHSHVGKVEQSTESGRPIIFGWTLEGKYIGVFEFEDDPELIIVRPITAYAVQEPGD